MSTRIQEVSSNEDVHRGFRFDAVNVCQFPVDSLTGVLRVVCDITIKPPAMIKWE
ncbi:hypothetical protein [Paenibacillus solani]|uniref:hypothetical protein n=1 Tax=Paenibacillus solani TaxID=1705565 RepID=UPI000AE41173|nr:hypothetical protein [Paenibacillus solani]